MILIYYIGVAARFVWKLIVFILNSYRNMKELERLRKLIEYRQKVEYREFKYYAILGTIIPNYGEGPFCQRCLDKEGILFQLQPVDYGNRYPEKWKCKECNREYV